MEKIKIGIAANLLNHATDTFDGNFVTYTPQGFVEGVIMAGGLPIVLPISEPKDAAQYVAGIDKLLLAGGQDVSPQFYGEQPRTLLGDTNSARDIFEIALVKEALRQKKPVFTVCRGTQLLNVALGGTLYQDLSEYEDWKVKHVQVPTAPWIATHEVRLLEGTHLLDFLEERFMVNSYHHQAIKKLAPELKAIAWATDGIIEAVESIDPKQRLLGVQWHPELTHKVDKQEQALFDYFVQKL